MFQQVFSMLGDGDVFLLTLTREGESLRVNLIPKVGEDSPGTALLPLSILASPAELDDPKEGFVAAITSYGGVRQGVLEAIRELEAAGKSAIAAAKTKTAPKESGGKAAAKAAEVKPQAEPVKAPWAKTPPPDKPADDTQGGLFSSAPATEAPPPDSGARRAALERELESLRARLETNATMLGFGNAFVDGALNAQLAAFPLGSEYNAKRAELEMLGSLRVIANTNPEWPATGNANSQEEAA